MTETKPRGRPKGSTNKQFSLTSYADKPELITLPKTETAAEYADATIQYNSRRIERLKQRLFEHAEEDA